MKDDFDDLEAMLGDSFDGFGHLEPEMAAIEKVSAKSEDYAKMDVIYVDPRLLKANPWNPNVVDPINQLKLETSIRKEGIKRPVVFRELEDGSYELIAGHHRTIAACDLSLDLVPAINRGKISDAQAKKESLIDNSRYGTDDPFKISTLLQDPDMGSADDLLNTLPIDEEELAGYFSHLTADEVGEEIDLILKDDDEPAGEMIDLAAMSPTKTHQVIRFRVPIADAAKIEALLLTTRKDQGFDTADELTNSGDALVYLLSKFTKE